MNREEAFGNHLTCCDREDKQRDRRETQQTHPCAQLLEEYNCGQNGRAGAGVEPAQKKCGLSNFAGSRLPEMQARG